MGYYTRFNFDGTPNHIEKRIPEVSGYDFEDPCKWYDYKQDIASVSKEYPAVLITCMGNGEEEDDLWVLYALNGEIQQHKAQIIYPPCTLQMPEMQTKQITVTVAGTPVTVAVTLPKSTPVKVWQDEARRIIKESLK